MANGGGGTTAPQPSSWYNGAAQEEEPWIAQSESQMTGTQNGIKGYPAAGNNPATGQPYGPGYEGQLQQQGYQIYAPGQSPTLNMGAYGPVQAAQFNPQLMSQLQAQMNGGGAANQALNAQAMAQLRQGTQANIASQAAMAAGQRGNQNPGAAQYQLAQGAANANQQAAGQAASTLAANQAALSGQATGALTQAAQANMQAQNQIGLANQANAQAGNQAQQAQYQYGQNITTQQQEALNAEIASMAGAGQLQGYQQTNNALSGAMQAGSGLASAGLTAALLAGAAAASGGVVDQPTIAGEAGPEAIVPLDGSQGDPHVFLEAMRQHYLAGHMGIAAPHMQGAALEEMLRSPMRGRPDLYGASRF